MTESATSAPRSPEPGIATPLATVPGTTVITVPGDDSYPVYVGRGLVNSVAEQLGSQVRKVLIVHTSTLGARAVALRESLLGSYDVMIAEVPDAEPAKRVEVAAFCWQVMGQADFSRTDVVIGLGGGAVTDLAGFVAATWLRGVKLVQIPTSVLGMVDAAVGGKNGINTAEGKNLVGTFWAPHAVICDLDLLEHLPRNEILAGFAEVVKAGFIQVPEILNIIEADVDVATDPTTPEFRRLIELSIEMKARIVGQDFKESGLREILNYGHTLGHAVEHAERYGWRHGAAVAVGMMFAAELAGLSGRLPVEAVDRHRRILESLTLPTTYPVGRWPTLLATMQRDKKTRSGMLRFVVLDDIGKPTIMEGPDASLLFSAYQAIGS